MTVANESEFDIVANNGICYAAKPNSLLVRSNGRLGKCTVAFEDERNDIGYIRPDGTIEVNQMLWRQWLRGSSNFNMCANAGGCPGSGNEYGCMNYSCGANVD